MCTCPAKKARHGGVYLWRVAAYARWVFCLVLGRRPFGLVKRAVALSLRCSASMLVRPTLPSTMARACANGQSLPPTHGEKLVRGLE